VTAEAAGEPGTVASSIRNDVTVVVPTWKRPELLSRCLDGVLSQRPQAVEVLVVARPEDDEAWAIIDQAAVSDRIRGVEVHEPGVVPPVRAALEACSTALMAIIDDDAVACPGWLGALLDIMEDRRVSVAGGFVFTPGTRVRKRRNAGRITWYGQHVGNVAAMESPTPVAVDGVMEGNWIWRTEVLRSLDFAPLFRGPNGAMYGLDLTLQAKERGHSVLYTSWARVLHTPGARSFDQFDRDDVAERRVYSKNYTYIALRHRRGCRRLLFALWWWLVGERGSYGIATALMDALNGKLDRRTLRADFSGKADGVRVWLAEG
jgi:GT2 family glycosyltransferase